MLIYSVDDLDTTVSSVFLFASCSKIHSSIPPSFPPSLPPLDGSFIFSNPGGDSSASGYVNISCPRYYDYSPSSCSVSGTSFPMCSNTTEVATLYCYDGKNDVCVSLECNCV